MTEINLKKTIGYAIIHISRLMDNKMTEQLCTLGDSMTREQGMVLLLLSQGKDQDMIQSDLAEVMDKSKSAVLRTIDLLEKKGYVTRMAVPDDRRKNRLEVTKSGLNVADHVLEMIKRKNKELLELIGQKDLDTFFKVLGIIEQKLEEEAVK